MNPEMQDEGGVSEDLEQLMSQVDRAVGLIEDLRRENQELKNQRQALQDEVGRKGGELEAIRSDRDRLQRIYNENAMLIEKKEEIQSKVETMLSRLASLELDAETGGSETP